MFLHMKYLLFFVLLRGSVMKLNCYALCIVMHTLDISTTHKGSVSSLSVMYVTE